MTRNMTRRLIIIKRVITMGLFDIFKKKHTNKIMANKSNNDNETKFGDDNSNHLEKELLVYNIISKEIKPLEDIVVSYAVKLKEKHAIDDEIKLLDDIIESYSNLKKKCIDLGLEYEDYFKNSWEEIRKDKSDGPSYINRYKVRLAYIKEHYLELKEEEERRNTNLINLDKRLIDFIISNQPILQSDIYKSFDSSVKLDIQDLLYHMAKDNIISREKSGRTYIITLK